jgi:hypothetical protein
MNRHALSFFTALISTLLIFSATARAQEQDAPKVEVGVQFSSLSVTPPQFFGTENAAGFGARVTYNLTDYFAVEGEGDIFPVGMRQTFVSGGGAQQVQFGVKVGKRFKRFGLFAKARPGFVSFDDTIKLTSTLVARVPGAPPRPFTVFGTERKTHFSTDAGGVLEFYPSRRLLVRFDAGDTIIRYGEHNEIGQTILIVTQDEIPIERVPAETRHNFQFSAGIGFRFRGGAGGGDDTTQTGGKEKSRRFEAGIQFSSLALRLSPSDFGFPGFTPADSGTLTEAGFGGRVGYNLNPTVALEAEGNFYPRNTVFSNSTTGGYPAQMQFGVKAGKRFERFGVFAKVRPGFVTFSRVFTLTGTQTITFGSQTFQLGIFEDRRRTYFSTDLGGTLEFYPTRRVFTRFDAGDTIIRYGERNAPGFSFSNAIFRIPASTAHNFQFTAGIGLRF